MKNLPVTCPSCSERLVVKRMRCEGCLTEIEGVFPLPPLASLSGEDQDFIVEFIKASGSLKKMAKIMRVSYPTVRNRLNEIIETVSRTQDEQENSSNDAQQ